MIGSVKRGSQGKGQRMDLNLTSLTCCWLAASVILRFNLTVIEYCRDRIGNYPHAPSRRPCSFRWSLCQTPVMAQLSLVPIWFRQWMQSELTECHIPEVAPSVSHISLPIEVTVTQTATPKNIAYHIFRYIETKIHNSLFVSLLNESGQHFCFQVF